MKIKNRKQTIAELNIRRLLVIRKKDIKGTYYPGWMYTIGKRPPKTYIEILKLIGGIPNSIIKWVTNYFKSA